MRKKSKSCRKATHRRMGGVPANNKENRFGSLFCSIGEIQDLRLRASEPVTRGSHFETDSATNHTSESVAANCEDKKTYCKGKQAKRPRRKRTAKSPNYEWYESNGSLTFPTSTYSSIAFFIPLHGNKSDENAEKRIIDWNGFYFYGSNASAMISRYNSERKAKLLRDRNLIPESTTKYRSSSESSATSDDSVVFANDDALFDDDDEDRSTSGTTNFSMENSQDGADEADCASTCSGKNSTRKPGKKVRFVDNSELVTVHVIVAWNYAYRAARISPWEVAARDSNRFKSKIQSLEPIIGRVLRPEHRRKIWQTLATAAYDQSEVVRHP